MNIDDLSNFLSLIKSKTESLDTIEKDLTVCKSKLIKEEIISKLKNFSLHEEMQKKFSL